MSPYSRNMDPPVWWPKTLNTIVNNIMRFAREVLSMLIAMAMSIMYLGPLDIALMRSLRVEAGKEEEIAVRGW